MDNSTRTIHHESDPSNAGTKQLGDKTSHGGEVVSAWGRDGPVPSTIDGIPVACIGDRVTCPKKGHSGAVIVQGAELHVGRQARRARGRQSELRGSAGLERASPALRMRTDLLNCWLARKVVTKNDLSENGKRLEGLDGARERNKGMIMEWYDKG